MNTIEYDINGDFGGNQDETTFRVVEDLIMKIGFMGLLFLLFLGLKLGGVITWSWWWVTAPIWGMLLPLIILLILSIFLKLK